LRLWNTSREEGATVEVGLLHMIGVLQGVRVGLKASFPFRLRLFIITLKPPNLPAELLLGLLRPMGLRGRVGVTMGVGVAFVGLPSLGRQPRKPLVKGLAAADLVPVAADTRVVAVGAAGEAGEAAEAVRLMALLLSAPLVISFLDWPCCLVPFLDSNGRQQVKLTLPLLRSLLRLLAAVMVIDVFD
jgi:hypothetical protein